MPKFRQKPFDVDGVQLTTQMMLARAGGVVWGAPGDWLVTYPDGARKFISDAEFRERFIALNDDAKALLDG